MDRQQLQRRMARVGACLALSLAVPATAQAAPTPMEVMREAIADVPNATAARFGARDDQGASLDGLKVLQVGARYVGVYHAPAGKSFAQYVATSTDLMTWRRRATLDTDASQAAITALPNGGFVVAYEKAFTAD